MKKPASNNSNATKNSTIAVSATLAEPRLLRSLVEDLAGKRYNSGYSREKVQVGFQVIETTSIEAFVSVDLKLSTAKENFNMPLVTSFVFTCTKGKWQNYNLTWVNSLS